MHVIGIIPARYESVRFPGKLLAPIQGKSLIQRCYENGKRAPSLKDLVVATDDERILSHIHTIGGEAVLTSPSCQNGTERLAEVVRNYPQYSYADIIVNIQGDEPLVEPEAIEAIIFALKDNPKASMATACIPLDPSEASDSSKVKVVLNLAGEALYFSRALIPAGKSLSMQTTAPYYKHIGIYAYRKDFLLAYAKIPSTPLQLAEDLEQLKVLECGYTIQVAIINSQSMGVDTPEDLIKVEKLIACKPNISL